MSVDILEAFMDKRRKGGARQEVMEVEESESEVIHSGQEDDVEELSDIFYKQSGIFYTQLLQRHRPEEYGRRKERERLRIIDEPNGSEINRGMERAKGGSGICAGTDSPTQPGSLTNSESRLLCEGIKLTNFAA